MAKTAKIFLSASDGGAASYTVPDGKWALMNFHGSFPQELTVNGAPLVFPRIRPENLSQMVFPEGTVIAMKASVGTAVFATGFEDDAAA